MAAQVLGLPEKQYLHAEIDALLKVKKKGVVHRIEVYRKEKSGLQQINPCVICQHELRKRGILYEAGSSSL